MKILKKNKINLPASYLVIFSSFILSAVADEAKLIDLEQNKSIRRGEFNDPTMPKFFLPEEPNESNFTPTTTPTTTSTPSTQNLSQGLETISNKLVLSVIVIKPNEKTAVINDQIVREKDFISKKYHVVKIESNKVILKKTTEVAKVVINKKKKNIYNKKEQEKEPEKEEIEVKEEFIELKLPKIAIKQYLDHP